MAGSENGGGHCVVAGMLIRRGSLLLCRRSADREWYPGVWDLPGGHLRKGERASAALVRELREELGIDVGEPSGACDYRLASRDFDLRVWTIADWHGTPANASPDEHDAVGWFSERQALGLHLADENYSRLISDALYCSGQR